MPSKFAHAMRSAELALAMPLLPAGGRILELGAGDGWQASILAQHGFEVIAIDVASTPTDATQFVPVTLYDGRTIPFPDGSFDAVFSSNVLEHVKDFELIQAELARVLATDGTAVHCVPSATWRFWTTVGHPLNAMRWLMNPHRSDSAVSPPPARDIQKMGPLEKLRVGLIAPRHGEHGNLASEHFLFSRAGWRRRFEKTRWQISTLDPTGLFYSGNELFALNLTIGFRRLLAKVLGSSTLMLVARPLRNAGQP